MLFRCGFSLSFLVAFPTISTDHVFNTNLNMNRHIRGNWGDQWGDQWGTSFLDHFGSGTNASYILWGWPTDPLVGPIGPVDALGGLGV